MQALMVRFGELSKKDISSGRGVGPGWALVGDAGHHKEFVIGDGITEALL